MLKMQAKERFSRVIGGQQYYGDPDHPNKDNGQRFTVLNEAHADQLEAEGVATRVKTKEVEDDDLGGADFMGERQEIVGERQTDVERAAASHEGQILGADEKTKGKSEDGSPIVQGGLSSTATDNHMLTHTTQRGGNATEVTGTPDPDAAPTSGPLADAVKKARGSKTVGNEQGTKPEGKTPETRQAQSTAGSQEVQGSQGDAAPSGKK